MSGDKRLLNMAKSASELTVVFFSKRLFSELSNTFQSFFVKKQNLALVIPRVQALVHDEWMLCWVL